MFGHQDEPTQPTTNDQPAAPVTSSFDSGGIAAPPADANFGSVQLAPPTTDTNYLLEAQAADGQTGAPAVQPAADATSTAPADPDVPVATDPVTPPAATPTGGSDSLIDLKQQALQQLSPLVGQLEQTPEEKFRTTMMLIQASDNQDLLQAAYDAANQITDEKARAQALLDVINEINYFSQSK